MVALSGDLYESIERDELAKEIADCRSIRSRCRGEIARLQRQGIAEEAVVAKLQLVIDACDRGIAHAERLLAE